MSAARDTNTDVIVYVKLLEEGADVWRPVPAMALPGGTFRLRRPDWYDPEDESWEFLPGATVKCTAKRFAEGEEGLVAVSLAE
ncbi:MAG TPA: hypothetical protein VNF04_09580 [Stellaceae bacterium]|nr:hypothetical protein [Stellaceae bacterium]